MAPAGGRDNKTVVSFAAVLPQFTDPGRGRVPLHMLALGLIFVLVAWVCDSVWRLVASGARAWFGGSPRRLRLVGGAGGLAMIGLGLGLADRPQGPIVRRDSRVRRRPWAGAVRGGRSRR